MMVRYTEDELVRAWCSERGLESAWQGTDSSSARAFGQTVRRALRGWYARLLLTAPEERLPVRDLWPLVDGSEPVAHQGLAMRLPQEGSRPVEVLMQGWERPVRVFSPLLGSAHRRQASRMRRSHAADPVAVLDGSLLVVYGFEQPPKGGTRPERLLMTAWPEDGAYEFDAADFPGEEIIKYFS